MTARAGFDVAVTVSEPRANWCPDCKAETAVAVDIYALRPGGVVYVTTVAVCELCDDPEESTRA